VRYKVTKFLIQINSRTFLWLQLKLKETFLLKFEYFHKGKACLYTTRINILRINLIKFYVTKKCKQFLKSNFNSSKKIICIYLIQKMKIHTPCIYTTPPLNWTESFPSTPLHRKTLALGRKTFRLSLNTVDYEPKCHYDMVKQSQGSNVNTAWSLYSCWDCFVCLSCVWQLKYVCIG
jgi:hypothetical protein